MATVTVEPAQSSAPSSAPATVTAAAATATTGRARWDLGQLGPNWYAAVMGTAIVANGAVALPYRVPGRTVFAEAVWALALAALLALVAARLVHLSRHRAAAREQLLENPATAVFYGCPPMALLAVGYGTLAVGSRLIGTGPAAALDLVLWSLGTLYAVLVAAGIPYLMVTRHELSALRANPTWLLPVVAPMVSAALGPVLLPHLPAALRPGLFYGCYALFGASLLATLVLLPVVFAGLVHSKLPMVVLTPTLFLVLGPLGQSTTAVNNLADAAHAVAPRLAGAAFALAVLYGVAMIGFALLWLLVAGAANLRALVRQRMPFALTWWAFTFPVGTCVTGAAGLARHTGLAGFGWLAVALYALLLVAWAVAGVRTVAALAGGRLLRAA
ncbi:SLAC1 family transporter [Kitasatospora kifunensis]|uniref:C4-dicarboxylate transporter/malic acid transport protein n=1 Tax=Kitasatospora kifunensis TaxID=58351 RepID=A0A7W7R356_KITKI|nr:C4-dicarboxylate ABC transporter [Kitasatospora kifunensis]MBB4924557.1 C4-dicarboxylate transporter/malic acid transport protein [Kitasatospora kifunensis]